MATTVEALPTLGTNIEDSTPPRFYRPELDALRFLAFFSVYLCHSIPAAIQSVHNAEWIVAMRDMGNFGVCLFFLLSAFLITELLQREYRAFSSIDIKAFYARRALRIWPLYFAITFLYILGSRFFPALRMEAGRIIAYFFFAGNWYIALHPLIQTPLRAFWSISVEEQFYLAWPWLMKYNSRFLKATTLGLVAISMCSIYMLSIQQPYAYVTVWVNSLTQLLFLAFGALLAIICKHRIPRINSLVRGAMFFAGFVLWWLAASVMHIKRPGIHPPYLLCTGYLLVAFGCALEFLALLGISARRIPSWTIYLGKISFGLYLWHETAFLLVDEAQAHGRKLLPGGASWITQHLAQTLLCNKTLAFAVTVALAALSYRFFETPFLRLKQRITVIESRGI
jgi:peptidoglycan/LPS O-acetylase OafA/YrhL